MITVRPADRQRPASLFRNRPGLGRTHAERTRQGYVVGTGVQGGCHPIFHKCAGTGTYGNIFGVPHIPGQGAVGIETNLPRLPTDSLTQSAGPKDHLTATNVGASRVVAASPDPHGAIPVLVHHTPSITVLIGEPAGDIQVDRGRTISHDKIMPASHIEVGANDRSCVTRDIHLYPAGIP